MKKPKEIGEGYKIIYSGRTTCSTRNGVGGILNEEMKVSKWMKKQKVIK